MSQVSSAEKEDAGRERGGWEECQWRGLGNTGDGWAGVWSAGEEVVWDDGGACMNSSHTVIEVQLVSRVWRKLHDEWARNGKRSAEGSRRE